MLYMMYPFLKIKTKQNLKGLSMYHKFVPILIPYLTLLYMPWVTLVNYLQICILNGFFLYLSFSSPKIMVVILTWLLSCDMKLNSFSALQYQKRLTDEGCNREILTSMFGYSCVQYGLLVLFQNAHTRKMRSDFCISNNFLPGMSKLKI